MNIKTSIINMEYFSNFSNLCIKFYATKLAATYLCIFVGYIVSETLVKT